MKRAIGLTGSLRPPRGHLLTALAVLLLLAAVLTTGLAHRTVTRQKSAGLVIDMAGRQRMLNERHLKEVLMAARGLPAPYAETRRLFVSTLRALADGGEAVVDPDRGSTRVLPPAPSEAIRLRLAEQEELMRRQIELADRYLEGSQRIEPLGEVFEELAAVNGRLTRHLDETTKLFDSHQSKRVDAAGWWAAAAAALLLVIGLGLVWQQLRMVRLNRRLLREEGRRRRARAHLEAIVESAVDGIIVIDALGIIQAFNPAAEKIFGLASSEACGRNVSILMPEPYQTEHDGYIRRYLETGEARIIGVGRDALGRRRDGTVFPIHLAISEMRIGETRMFVGITRDISEEKRVEEALRRSEERFQLAVRGSSDGLWDWDVTTDEVWYAPRFKQMLGYEGDEFPHVFASFESHLHPDDREPTLQAVAAHLEARQTYDVEYRLRTKKDGYRWFRARGQAFWDDGGKPLRMAGSIQDITRRKQDEQRLNRQALESRLIHQATTMAAETDSFQEALQSCVDIVCQMTGWPVGHVYLPDEDGSDLMLPTEIWHLDDGIRFAEFRRITESTPFALGVGLPGRIWESGEPAWIADVQKDENFPRARLSENIGVRGAFGFPIKIRGATEAVLEFFTDEEMAPDQHLLMMVRSVGEQVGRVIERRRAEDQLRLAKEAAEEASRAKSQFLANMSHELRTPLNAIIGYSELLEEDAVEVEETAQAADLRRIQAAGKQLLGLINDVLDLSKVEAGRMSLQLEGIELPRLVEEAAITVQPLFERSGNRLQIRCSPEASGVFADATRLRQVLLNLLSNANKFTERGVVVVETGPDPDDPGKVRLQVTDSGIGMSRDEIARVFEPFAQADGTTTRKYGGTGLGLAICRKLCEVMNGSITVESRPGEGSTFSVTLPAEPARPSVPEGAAAGIEAAQPESPAGTTVLVIDDDPQARDLLSRHLTREGFTVRTAQSGSEGIELARTLLPAAITLDIMMPTLDGWAVLTEIKKDPVLAKIPVIVVTLLENRQLGFALGASDYLVKPLDRRELLRAISRHVRPSARRHILVVDDDPGVRDLIRRTLVREGWQLEEAANGREALERMRRQTPDMVLLDLMMPEMDGFQVVEEMRRDEAWRSVPVVVLTAKELNPTELRKLQGSVRRILRKGSYTRRDLLEELQRQLQVLAPLPVTTGSPSRGEEDSDATPAG